jgi:hypothetical protein
LTGLFSRGDAGNAELSEGADLQRNGAARWLSPLS